MIFLIRFQLSHRGSEVTGNKVALSKGWDATLCILAFKLGVLKFGPATPGFLTLDQF